jgi:cation transport ATPase
MRTDPSQPVGDGVNANQDAPNTTLRGRWLLAARAGWVVVAALTLGVATAGFAVGLRRPELIHPQSARAALAQAGVPGQVTVVVALIIPMAAFAATGLLIFWRRSNDWAAMLFALTLVTGTGLSMRAASALERAAPALWLPARLVLTLATFLSLIVLFVFPDGRLVPRWTRLLVAAAVPAVMLTGADLPRIFVELPDVPPGVSKARLGLAVLVWSGFWAAGIYAQAYRYRHVSGPVQRQQTKWVAFTFGLVLVVLLLGFVIPSLVVDTANAWFAWALLATVPLIVLFPASVAVAILRHRLYDIDRLITRTLTYGLLTVVLGVVYAGAVVVLGQALNPRGGDSPLAVAASTLLVAVLFQPARRRIQQAVDRRFNRRRYDAAKAIEAFSARMHEQLDLDTLTAELLAVVDHTVEPTAAWLWLRPQLPRPDGRHPEVVDGG